MDTSSWNRAYNSLQALLNDNYDGVDIPASQRVSMRNILMRDDDEKYYSWMLAAMAPWAVVPVGHPPQPGSKEPPPRAAMVARESLRSDNKTITLITVAVRHQTMVSDITSAFAQHKLGGSLPDIRWELGRFVRSLGRDWRLCVVHAMLLDIMRGRDAGNGEHSVHILSVDKTNPDSS